MTGNDRREPSDRTDSKRDSDSDLWTERDLSSGRFVEDKESGGSFKGVRRER